MTVHPAAVPTVEAPAGRSVMAVLAVVACFFLSPLGLVLGIVARRKVKRTGQKGANFALAAIILGSAFLAFDLLVARQLPLVG